MTNTLSLTEDISKRHGAWYAQSIPVVIQVEFAQADGFLQTLEGSVKYNKGDALLTGIHNERWPVERQRFLEKYQPQAGIQAGENGAYTKRTQFVWAWRVNQSLNLILSNNRGTLHANTGDIVVQYALGDFGVVRSDIFDMHYTRCKKDGEIPDDIC